MSKSISILIITCLFLVCSTSLQAKTRNKILCPSYYAWKLKDRLPSDAGDKLKHCTLSCWLGRRCTSSEVMLIGAVKEVADALGLGNAEWEDLTADVTGIRLSYGAFSDAACLRRCQKNYP